MQQKLHPSSMTYSMRNLRNGRCRYPNNCASSPPVVASPRLAGMCHFSPALWGGVKGHNMNKTSFAHILFATGVPGKPRPMGGELHKFVSKKILFTTSFFG
jgi:hypothetical protein